MARPNVSAGRRLGTASAGGCHQIKAAMTPSVLTALSQNGAASPQATMMSPASAGPTARLTLMPTPLSATAGRRCSRGTSCGMIESQAGAMRAAAVPPRKLKPRSAAGVARPDHTRSPKPATSAATITWTTINNRRRSTISASAPPASANRNIGSEFATCTSATTSGSGSRLVISHPAAAFCIQVPILDTTVATHSTAKVGCRNGLSDEASWGGGAGGLLSTDAMMNLARVGAADGRRRMV